jgi:hypothetical protein
MLAVIMEMTQEVSILTIKENILGLDDVQGDCDLPLKSTAIQK